MASLTRYEIGRRLFALFGKDPNETTPSTPAAPTRHPDILLQLAVLGNINGAIQEMIKKAPTETFRDRRSSLLMGGTINLASFGVNAGSSDINFGVPLPTTDENNRIGGCAIIVGGGDNRVNRLVYHNAAASGQPIFRLQFAHLGTGLNYSDVPVYLDTWMMRTDEDALIGPVELHRASGRKILQCYRNDFDEIAAMEGAVRVLEGIPDAYTVETVQSENGIGVYPYLTGYQPGQQRTWIRLNRFPTEVCSITYGCTIKPTSWALTDITDSASAGALLTTNLPWGWEESVFVPICEQRCTKQMTFIESNLTGVSAASRENILSEIYRGYEEALAILAGLHPQRQGADYMTAVD